MSQQYTKFQFSALVQEKSLSIDEVRHMLQHNLMIKKGYLNPAYIFDSFVKKHNLEAFFKNVLWYTSFLDEGTSMRVRLLCIIKDITEYPLCKHCGGLVKRPVACHSAINFRFSDTCSARCSRMINNPWKHVSREKRALASQSMSLKRKVLFKDGMPGWWKQKLKTAANRESVKAKKRATNKERYGIENPGVLGAFHSKVAFNYIQKFLCDRGIDEERCFYHDKQKGKQEFFQVVFVPFLGKKRFFSYDLVVFKTKEAAQRKELNSIELVLEYNGVWHYSEAEIKGHEEEPAVPYKGDLNNFTKKQMFELDSAKLQHMLHYTKFVFVYNEKARQLICYNGHNL